VGNRALGERLNHLIDLASYRAVSVLLLLAPEVPLLFMGQEWASSSPFQYFTDHSPELGRLVTEGRRREFARFAAFSDPAAREKIPDPQDRSTFVRSHLNWEEAEANPHAGVRRLYQALLHLRASDSVLKDCSRAGFEVAPLGENGLLLCRKTLGDKLLAVVRLRDSGTHDLRKHSMSQLPQGLAWRQVMTTEDPTFAHDPVPPEIALAEGQIQFGRPGAVVLRAATGPTEGGE
jgi:maltooligosyltrehalose trehalohydrolase